MKREIVETKKAPAAVGPYSQAVKANGMLFISGQLGINPDSGDFLDGIENQVEQSLKNIEAILKAANSSLDKVVKATVFLKDMHDFDLMNKVYAKFFSKDPPARCCVEVSRLPMDAKVEIEVIAEEDKND